MRRHWSRNLRNAYRSAERCLVCCTSGTCRDIAIGGRRSCRRPSTSDGSPYLRTGGEYVGDLVCWCAPESCHGDLLLKLANLPPTARMELGRVSYRTLRQNSMHGVGSGDLTHWSSWPPRSFSCDSRTVGTVGRWCVWLSRSVRPRNFRRQALRCHPDHGGTESSSSSW
jgi:hypothetical protein